MSSRLLSIFLFVSLLFVFVQPSFAFVCNPVTSTDLCGGNESGAACLGGFCTQSVANSDQCFCQKTVGSSTCSDSSSDFLCRKSSVGARCSNGGVCTLVANMGNLCECTQPVQTPTPSPEPTVAMTCSTNNSSNFCGGFPVGRGCLDSSGKSGSCVVQAGTSNSCYCLANPTPAPAGNCHPTNSKNRCNNNPVGTGCLDDTGKNGQCVIQVPSVNNCYCLADSAIPTPGTATPTPSTPPTYPTYPSLINLTPTPVALKETAVKCDLLNASYPPNTECYSAANWVPVNITDYELTCVPAPEVTYTDTVTGSFTLPIVPVKVQSDVSDARLGGYGPDATTINTSSTDYLSKNYLYNALFDKPNFTDPNTPREMYRTYWRLLSAYDQANLKSMYLNKVMLGQSTSLSYTYVKNGEYKKIDSRSLYLKLFSQETIVSLIPPNIQIGCLIRQPVCKEFATITNDLANNLLDRDLKEEYDALIPFDWNDIRSYILTKGLTSTVAKENIPYVGAILDGLTNNYGMLNILTPSWVDNSPAKHVAFPVNSLTNINDMYLGPVNLTEIIQRAGGILNMENLIETEARVAALGFTQCIPPPQSKGISSPKTYPEGSTSVDQTILVTDLKKTLTNTFDEYIDRDIYNTQEKINNYCKDGYYHAVGTSLYCQHQTTTVMGTGRGEALFVLNNPMMTDVDTAVAGDDKKPGLVQMLVPDFVKLPEKIAISAPNVSHGTTTTGANVTNPASPIYRQSNLAQDTMAELQNCWSLPSSMQDSPQCRKNLQYSTGGQCKLSDEPLTGKCNKSSFTPYLGSVKEPFKMVVPNVSPEVEAVYAEAERQTGVSCVILAGIHFREGGNNSCQSLISGRPIGTPEPDKGGKIYNTLLESAIAAANELKAKGASQPGFENLVSALSNYNGGGNSNCRSGNTANIYGFCPPDFVGEDDPYALSWLDTKHSNMILRCISDGVCTGTGPFNQPGAYTVSLSYYLSLP